MQTCGGLLLTGAAARTTPRGGSAGRDETLERVGPRSKPPARHMYAFRLEELPANVRELRMTLHCLQGLVNREQPRLYLVQDRYDELWLDWLKERGDIDTVEWIEIGRLFDMCLPVATCMFVTDPAVPASVNVATMLAGIHNGVVATPAMQSMFNLSMGAYPDSYKVGADLRVMHWKKDVEAYRWLFASYGDRLSRRAVAYLDPETEAVRDFFVQHRIPILWISNPNNQSRPNVSFFEERDFVRGIFLQWPPNIPCMGWPLETGIGEWEGVRLASECAKFEVCSGNDGYSPTVSNLSVHSGTTATLTQRVPAAPRLDRDKIYYAFVRSDGDGLNFLRHYYRKLYDDPQHGKVPLGWHVGATATDFMPDILDYYYKHATPGDCFLNALTGVGYIHEDSYADAYPAEEREKIWQEYLRISELYRARLDATTLATFAEMDPAKMARFAGMSGIKGVFANYGRTHVVIPENQVSVSAGKPVFRAVNGGATDFTFTSLGRRQAVNAVVNSVRDATPTQRPAFMHVFLANWLSTMEMAESIAKGLGPGYVAVRPDQLPALFAQARS